ncbi:TolC family protein [Formosa haliotis]|uniref:TolC family protein n=1 Tax=Formosa haliotis TaxID=1555194 RepID=UPI001356650A|nr:TolC family protein [Formosa haliotis]
MNTIKKTQIIFSFSLVFISGKFVAQSEKEFSEIKQNITLNEVLTIASKHSLDVYKAKRKYGISYWDYKSFKASLLPKIDFETRPFTYSSALVQRYDSEQNIDVFRQQQTINSYADVYLSQNIGMFGTKLYMSSSFDRLENFGEIETVSYNVTPLRVGLIQPIMAFNTFKWKDQIAPLEVQKAKQNFIYELQEINLKTIRLFFDWALANQKVKIAKENKSSAQKLFNIGKKRYDLIAIERDELLNLELEVYNSSTNLTQCIQDLQKTESEMKLYLRDQLPSNLVPVLPEMVSDIVINLNKAIGLAYQNNPNIIDLKLKKIEALRDLDKEIKENRFDLSVTASYGLNQQADTFAKAYSNFLNQQLVAIQLNIPILDWGERHGKIEMAKMNNDVIEVQLEQTEEAFKQEVTLKVLEFNLQKELVMGKLRTREISKESYNLTQQRFISGNVDFLNLSASRKAWQLANENYIMALKDYWTLYYNVQKLTLFNFIEDTELIQDYTNFIEE